MNNKYIKKKMVIQYINNIFYKNKIFNRNKKGKKIAS